MIQVPITEKHLLNQRIKFLNKFYLFSGTNRSSNAIENSLKDPTCFFKCNQAWPLCVFDFTYKSIIPEYFIYKTCRESFIVRENYFYEERKWADLDLPIQSQENPSKIEEEES